MQYVSVANESFANLTIRNNLNGSSSTVNSISTQQCYKTLLQNGQLSKTFRYKNFDLSNVVPLGHKETQRVIRILTLHQKWKKNTSFTRKDETETRLETSNFTSIVGEYIVDLSRQDK